MPKLENSIVIERPPAVVFAFFADPPRWLAAAPEAPVREIRPLFSGPVGVGSRYQVVEQTINPNYSEEEGAESDDPMPLSASESEWEVAEYDPPHSLVLRVPNSSGVISTWAYHFTATAGGTRVEHTQEIYLPGAARALPDFGDPPITDLMRTFQDVMWTRMADVMQQATQEHLARIKQWLEAEAD